ncbi:hypothetical protein CMV_006490 [Castanea mollissima]|uniref:Uncharacterized protein n=1 Tax=Castanea mollissima TaxID=60419 RepID=A0A8J4RPD7_9ROSI|nr:hypothetical protein CMV_006490 [Castanea mollissima]
MNKHGASAATLLWFISFSLATNQTGATVSVSHQRSHKTASFCSFDLPIGTSLCNCENQHPSIDDEGVPIVINCITVECLP